MIYCLQTIVDNIISTFQIIYCNNTQQDNIITDTTTNMFSTVTSHWNGSNVFFYILAKISCMIE